MTSVFDTILTSASQLEDPEDEITENYFEQVSPSRDVTGSTGNIAKGTVSFKWSLSPSEYMMLSRSYFRLRVNLTQNDGSALLIADQTGPAPNYMGCMIAQATFLMGGNIVSSCTANYTQCDTLMKRINMPGSLLRSGGRAIGIMETDVLTKAHRYSDDGKAYYKNGYQTGNVDGTVEIVNANTALPKSLLESKLAIKPADKAGTFEVCYQPHALGIWNTEGVIPGGDFEIQLVFKPSTQFHLASVHSGGVGKTATNADIKVDVKQLDLFVQKVRGPAFGHTSDPQQYFIKKDEVSCQIDLVNSAALKRTNFEISPKTKAVTLAFQSRLASSDTRMPESMFVCYGNPVAAIIPEVRHNEFCSELSFSYGGRQYPQQSIELKSGHLTSSQLSTHRYLNSLLGTGQYHSGDIPTEREFQERGPYYYHPVSSENKSNNTRLTVSTRFTTTPATRVADVNLVAFSHYSENVQVILQNGKIKSVQVDRR